MSTLYLIRHGQAGLRHRYDTLSELGRRQARLLGEYLAGQGIHFSAIYSGGLARQRQTAEEVHRAYREAGLSPPEIVTEKCWNEFDLDQVYRELAPQLCAADRRFRADYDELVRQARDESSAIHHTWSRCDREVVRAWIAGSYPCRGESWGEFQERVWRPLEDLAGFAREDAVAVFTSATPISVWVGRTLGVANGQVMRLAGALYNSALTTLRLREREPRLFSFNSVPHLPQPEMRTFR